MNEKIADKKILLATGLYPPEIGGPATYAQMLEEQLPKHGFSLTVVPYGKVRHLPKLFRHVSYFWLLWREAQSVDVVYALDPVSVGVPAWFVSFLRRKPFMLRLGGDYAWEQGQQRFGLVATLDEYTTDPHQARWPVRLLALVQSFVTRRAKTVIVPSAYLKSIVINWGVAENDIKVVYSALFPLVVDEDRGSLREQFAFTDFVITSVGRLVPWKGFATLVSVVAELRTNGLPVSLVIAGDGPEAEKLEVLIKDKALENDVRLVGRLSKDALGAIIKASDCFVLNTSYEGLSHQLLEVMDLRVPVVTTNVGGNPELITNGVSGLLVDFNDAEALAAAIKRLHDNEPLRQRLIQSARLRTQDFAQEKVVSDLVGILNTI